MSDDNETARYLDRVAHLVANTPREPIYHVASQMYTRWQLGAAFLTCGNGGSAATASHLVCDLTKATRHEGRKTVRALCLTDNMASLTAWANDDDYEHALAEQVRSLGRAGDVLIAISGSGNSPNILHAVKAARAHSILVVALTGQGGQLEPLADLAIVVPSYEMAAIEDCHMAICHALTNNLRDRIAL